MWPRRKKVLKLIELEDLTRLWGLQAGLFAPGPSTALLGAPGPDRRQVF